MLSKVLTVYRAISWPRDIPFALSLFTYKRYHTMSLLQVNDL
jgi:hypothetical protein